MIEEDYRYISCGGDPLTYLKSAFKAMKIELEPGQEGRMLFMKEKFPYDRNIFSSLATQNAMDITKFEEKDGELTIEMVRNQQN
ncbi:MAG: hypothetical protein RE472_07270 [Thermoplasmatales archaeon]|jgi:hypothetical protein|nr:MAG: hypothetical protein AMDU5_GPLC00006G0034 [Thermoplasmatales archaeon Gpl]WMT48866.1 MAG: hypothetical protein RE472_07270 [Thermoplasmatales archaeon]